MPHWGLYLAGDNMANLSPEQREEILNTAVESMKSLRDKSSVREQYYMDAVIALHEKDGDEGVAAHNKTLLALLNEYPDEIEARLFLWTQLDAGYDARAIVIVDNTQGADAIIARDPEIRSIRGRN